VTTHILSEVGLPKRMKVTRADRKKSCDQIVRESTERYEGDIWGEDQRPGRSGLYGVGNEEGRGSKRLRKGGNQEEETQEGGIVGMPPRRGKPISHGEWKEKRKPMGGPAIHREALGQVHVVRFVERLELTVLLPEKGKILKLGRGRGKRR